MALELKLTAQQTSMLLLDSTELKLEFANTGGEDLVLADPFMSNEQPVFRVLDLATGEERTIRRRRANPMDREIPRTMKPGDTLAWHFELKEQLTFPGPGKYEIAAEYTYDDGAGVARSAPLQLELLPMTVQTMVRAVDQELKTPEFYYFWQRDGEQGVELMRSLVQNFSKPEVMETVKIANLPQRVQLVASNCPNRGNPLHTWLAWLDGVEMKTLLVEMDVIEHEPVVIDLPDVLKQLAGSPLIADDGHGEFALWLAGRQSRSAKVQLALTSPTGASRPGGDTFLGDTVQPLWLETAYLAAGQRRLYTAQRQQDAVTLRMVSWKDGKEVAEPTELLRVPGHFVAAGRAVTPADEVVGVLVTRPADNLNALEIVRWLHPVDGPLAADPSETVEFLNSDKIDRYLVRFDYQAQPLIVLRPSGDKWQIRLPGEIFAPVGGIVGDTKSPLDLFFNRVGEPVFTVALPDIGFQFFNVAGIPAGSTKRG